MDGTYAHASIGGPYFIMTLDGPFKGGTSSRLSFITAHEIGHIFYATDEYNGVKEYSGYLNASDNDYANCLLRWDVWKLCDATQEQIGWRDTDSDGILDIMDTFPETALNSYSISNNILTYAGFVTEVPYPNHNPYTYTWPTHQMRDITINTIADVEYRIDSGQWHKASPIDVAFDEAVESFTFSASLPDGTHLIEVRGINSVGNIDPSYTRLVVTPTAPVGGNTYQIEAYTTARPITPYLVTIVILTIGFTVIKRKTARKTKLQPPTSLYHS